MIVLGCTHSIFYLVKFLFLLFLMDYMNVGMCTVQLGSIIDCDFNM